MTENVEGMLTGKEIKEAFAMEKGSFQLGHIHPAHGQNSAIGISGDQHLFIAANSRSGKGVTMIINNLLHWQGGVFCIDPKGENASITASRRGKKEYGMKSGTTVRKMLGQDVAILDPMNIVKGASKIFRVNYDPLADIDKNTDLEASQILQIADDVVIGDESSGAHFTDSVRTILAGLIEAVIHNEKGENVSLATVRKIYLHGLLDVIDEQTGDVLEERAESYLSKSKRTPAALAENALAILKDAGDEESGSFSTTLSRQLIFMADPRMQRHLKNEGFSLKEAVRKKSTIYVCLPPNEMGRMKRWLRMIVSVGLNSKMQSAFEHEGLQTLFVLDEFYSLGKMKLIEESAAFMAGYGIKLMPVIQNIGQIKQLYEKNWETFLANAGAIILWALNDLDTEQYASDRMGNILTWETSKSVSRSRGATAFFTSSVNESQSAAQHERPIRRANEIHYEGAKDNNMAYVITTYGKPFMIERSTYWERWPNEKIYDDPDAIRAWEEAHG